MKPHIFVNYRVVSTSLPSGERQYIINVSANKKQTHTYDVIHTEKESRLMNDSAVVAKNTIASIHLWNCFRVFLSLLFLTVRRILFEIHLFLFYIPLR